MKQFLFFLIPIVMLAGLAAWRRRRNLIALDNTLSAQVYPTGIKTLNADNLMPARFSLVRLTSGTTCDLAGSATVPCGIIRDEVTAVGQAVAVRMLGAPEGTEVGIADAAITLNTELVAGATPGRIRILPATPGTYQVIGRAMTAAAAAGDLFEFNPCVPYTRVV